MTWQVTSRDGLYMLVLYITVMSWRKVMKKRKESYTDDAQKARYESVYSELSEYVRRGVRVSVQGKEYPVGKSARIMTVNENDCYMPDMTFDEYGMVKRVNYDKIVRR